VVAMIFAPKYGLLKQRSGSIAVEIEGEA